MPADSLTLHAGRVWPEPGRYAALALTGGGCLALEQTLKTEMNGMYAGITMPDYYVDRMHLAMPTDLRGVTPARILHCSCRPLARTPAIHSAKRSIS